MTKRLIGLALGSAATREANPAAEAVLAEDAGFDFVSMSDHLHGTSPTFEPWTALTWALARTSRVRVLTRVLGVPYRSPAVVAKMAETLDRLSDGRLILGLGGGYSDEEFEAFGLSAPDPRAKIEGLEEAVRVIRGLWSEVSLTFEGSHHRTRGARLEPKPDHPIPIWLGTYGPRALEVTGRVADGWIPSYGYAPAERLPGMLARVRAAAEAEGRARGAVLPVLNAAVRVDEAAASDGERIAGAPQAIADEIRALLGLGFEAVSLIPDGTDPERQRDRLAAEVLPLLRAA